MDELGAKYRVEYPMNVVLTNCKFRCTKCKKWKPAAEFGLRCMEDEIIRNQAQCRSCRHEPKQSKPRLRRVK